MLNSAPEQTRPPARLPATRERRPAIIALAVLLIVGGAVASGWLAMQSGDRASFLKINREVAQGAQITKDDVSTVSLPRGYSGGIAAGSINTVVGKAAAVRLLPGTVLTPAMVARSAGIAAGRARLSVPVTSASLALNLRAGDPVAVAVGSGQTSTVVSAVVVSVMTDTQTPQAVVSLDQSCISTVAEAARSSDVSIALIGGGASSVQSTCGGD